MSEPFLGEIRSFAFNFAPKGWALCNGQLLTIAQNQALFSILGTTYGGNGTTNFALPDLRGRTPMHPGQSLSAGTRIGVETMTLLISQLPAHTHTIVASSAEATLRSPAGSMPAAPNGENIYTTSTPDTANVNMIATAGSTQPYDNMQPFLVINYCIALQGVYPSRS